MKRKHLLFAVLLFSFFAFKLQAQTVYITDTGKKYHKKNCTAAKTGKKGMELAEAKKQNYEACKVCKPEEAVEPKKEATEPKKEKTKTKSTK